MVLPAVVLLLMMLITAELYNMRIEYAGYAYQPDKEVNSLTMAAVGRNTAIDHVQVVYAKG